MLCVCVCCRSSASWLGSRLSHYCRRSKRPSKLLPGTETLLPMPGMAPTPECPCSAREVAPRKQYRNISRLCISFPSPHLCPTVVFSEYLFLGGVCKAVIISQQKKHTSVVRRNLFGGTLRGFETEGQDSPQLTF